MAVKALSPMSALNPNAPQFVPAAFLATEDFSAQWWNLIKSDAAFRDYWLRERFVSLEEDEDYSTFEDLEEFSAFDEFLEMEMSWEEADTEGEIDACEAEYGIPRSSEIAVTEQTLKLDELLEMKASKQDKKYCNSHVSHYKPNKVPVWRTNVQKINCRIQQPRA